MYEYIEKGEYAPREGLEYSERENVALVLYYEDKFGVLKYNHVNYKSLVTGGVEKNETLEQAVLRECTEETGYTDISSILPLKEGKHVAKFYVEHKHQNRLAYYHPFLIKLNSLEKIDVAESELDEHSFIWLTEEEVRSFGMFDNHLFMFDSAVREINKKH